MKPPKPGQYCSLDGVHIVRVAKRTNGCKGCILENNIYTCPGVKLKGQQKMIDCLLYDIIFIKP